MEIIILDTKNKTNEVTYTRQVDDREYEYRFLIDEEDGSFIIESSYWNHRDDNWSDTVILSPELTEKLKEFLKDV